MQLSLEFSSSEVQRQSDAKRNMEVQESKTVTRFAVRRRIVNDNRESYLTRTEARSDVFDYIERWHNPRRRRAKDVLDTPRKPLSKVSVETG